MKEEFLHCEGILSFLTKVSRFAAVIMLQSGASKELMYISSHVDHHFDILVAAKVAR